VRSVSPIASWLKAARTSQAMPENGRPWTQDYFLARIKAETGWAPAYANYNKLEQGKSQPRTDTLDRLVAFWAGYGIEAPDLGGELAAPELTIKERTVRALEESARQAKRQADAWETIAAAFTPGAPTSPFGQSIVGLIQAFAAEQGQAPPPRPAGPAPLLGR
jgi:transcriptional regulator with XRE-family HTH domain